MHEEPRLQMSLSATTPAWDGRGRPTDSQLAALANANVSRNLTDNVAAASVSLSEAGHLRVTYFVTNDATDDDREWLEICATEIISEIWGVVETASTHIARVSQLSQSEDTVVYSRT